MSGAQPTWPLGGRTTYRGSQHSIETSSQDGPPPGSSARLSSVLDSVLLLGTLGGAPVMNDGGIGGNQGSLPL